MKENLRSACLLLLFSFFFIAGFVDLGNASKDTSEDPYNFSLFEGNGTRWGKIGSPTSDYNIWGYTGKLYYFSVDYTALSPENTTMVFYWNCSGNKSEHSPDLPLNEKNSSRWIYPPTNDKNNLKWKYPYKWNKSGTYLVAVGIFNGPASNISCPNISYWVPIEIRNNTTIIVQNFSMLEEKEGFGCSDRTYNVSSSDNSENIGKYCGYVKNDYSFSARLNATSLSNEDNRTISEVTTVVCWDDNNSDNSILRSIDKNKTLDKNLLIENRSDKKSYYITWNENFSHEWNSLGEKNISATTYHWDPLDGSEVYTNYTNKSILIIRDPKNFVSLSIPYVSPIIGIFSNLQTWGIFLFIAGLIMFFFTYTKNNVPVKISLFGLKPFYLRSVNSFKGTFTLVTGMYLYFVFGRCPWDIPIVSVLPWLPDMYFNVLYYEYTAPLLGISSLLGIPYLSILLGLVIVLTLSLIIHLIAIPFYTGELKIGKFSRRRDSTKVQPQQDSDSIEGSIDESYSIENKKHYEINIPERKGDGFWREAETKEEM